MKHLFFAVALLRSACDPEPPVCVPEQNVPSSGGTCEPYERYVCDIDAACARNYCRCVGGNQPIGPGPTAPIIVQPAE